jgi:hypothetical protein
MKTIMLNGVEVDTAALKRPMDIHELIAMCEELIKCVQELPEFGDEEVEADLLNAIDGEYNDSLFVDHPELKEAVVREFGFDYTDYNYALILRLQDEADNLGIDLSEYEIDN